MFMWIKNIACDVRQRRNANETEYLLLSHFVLGRKVHGCILPPNCLRGVLSSKSSKCYSLSLLKPRISLLHCWGSRWLGRGLKRRCSCGFGTFPTTWFKNLRSTKKLIKSSNYRNLLRNCKGSECMLSKNTPSFSTAPSCFFAFFNFSLLREHVIFLPENRTMPIF